MKEIVDALNDRIRTPYFGYSILAFLAMNWRGIFLLIVSDGTPEERLASFDNETSVITLLVIPLAIGALVAASANWLRYIFAMIERKPKELMGNLQLEAEHKITIKQTQLEQARSELFAVKEIELIERAKRDEEVENLEDSEMKEKLMTELSKLRNERDHLSKELERRTEISEDLSFQAKELLLQASADKAGTILKLHTLSERSIQIGKRTFGDKDQRSYVAYEAALDQLLEYGLIKELGHNGEAFELTHKGWQLASKL